MASKVTALIDVKNKAALAKLNQSGKAFKQLKGDMMGAIGIAVGAGLAFRKLSSIIGNMSGVAMEFESSMKFVQVVTRSSAEDMNKLSDAALDMAAKTKFTATEVADAMKTLGLVGMKTNDILMVQMDILAGAQATQSDVATTTDAVVGTMKAYNMAAKEGSHITDVFAKASTESALDMNNLKESMKVAGISGAVFATDMEDTVAIMGVLHDRQIKGTLAGQSMKMALAQLSKETPKLNAALSKVGLTYDEVNPKTHSLVDILEKLAKTNVTVTEAQDLFGKRAGPNMMAVVNAIKDGTAKGGTDLRKFADSLKNVEDGFAKMLAKEQMDTMKGQLLILASNFEALKIHIGKLLNKAFKPFVKAMSFIIGLFNRAPKLIKAVAAGVLVAAAAFAGLVAVLALAKIATLAWAAATAFATGGISLIIPAIGAAVAALMVLWHAFKDKLEPALRPIGALLNALFIVPLKFIFGIAKNIIGGFIETITGTFKKGFEFLGGLFDALIPPFRIIGSLVKSVIVKSFQILGRIISWIVTGIKSMVTSFINSLPFIQGIKIAIIGIKNAFEGAKKSLGGMIGVITAVRNAFINMAISILQKITMIAIGIHEMLASVKDIPGMGKAFESVGKGVEKLISTINELKKAREVSLAPIEKEETEKEKKKEKVDEDEADTSDFEGNLDKKNKIEIKKFQELQERKRLEEQQAIDARRAVLTAENEQRIIDEALFEERRQALIAQHEELKTQAEVIKTEAARAEQDKALEALREHEGKKTGIEQAASIARIETAQATAASIFGIMVKHNKKYRAAQRIFQFATAMRNAFVAISEALKLPYPANLFAAAQVGIQAISNAHQILKYQKGTAKVPGTGRGDKVPAMLEPGEMVIRRDIAEQIRSGSRPALKQGISKVVKNETTNNNTFQDREDIDYFMEKFDRTLARAMK